jgi:hypothetical protein
MPRLRALAVLLAASAAACGRGVRLPEVPAPIARTWSAATVDASTLQGKLMFGYQGWFGCPGDGSPGAAWRHWFARGATPAPQSLRVDMWPETSELEPGEGCETDLTRPDGEPAVLFSSYQPRTVARHFRWLADYGLPGIFLQRFSVELRAPPLLAFRDGVTNNVRAAAEAHGRVFAVMYDVTGHPPAVLVRDVQRDWMHLVDDLRVTDSPRYLRHQGLPLVAIWGLGFTDRAVTPEQAADLIAFFRNPPDPRYRATLLGGVPAGWRTLSGDAQADPRWAEVYRAFDVLSPWLVGRFRNITTLDRFYRDHVEPDVTEVRRAGIDYLPVLFPGFSWHNLHSDSALNRIPRLGGRLFWRQVLRALDAGATMLYVAMFDEVDEGTAMFKLAPARDEVPAEAALVTLDADGETLPSDWYLRLAREAQRRLSAATAADRE